MEGPVRVAECVAEQYERAFTMLSRLLKTTPDDVWRRVPAKGALPSGLALHILETIDFYLGELSVDDFPWGHRFGVDWEEMDPALLPERALLVTYLEEMQQKANGWLGEVDLDSTEEAFPWVGRTKLSRSLYVLRNTQHHIGELSAALKASGIEPVEWS